MKTICAIAMTAFVLMSASAGAGTSVSTTTTSTNCKRSAYGPQTCTTTTSKNEDSEQSSAAPPKQRSAAEIRKEQEEAEARIRQWEAFCRPTKAIDKFGITRLSYAHEGCEFGISQDTESFAQVK